MGAAKRNRTFSEDVKIVVEGRVSECQLQKQAEQQDVRFLELVGCGVISKHKQYDPVETI